MTTSNLAGRTRTDLIAGRDTERVRLPWVGHVSPAWEPEPLCWLGVQGVWAMGAAADRADDRGRRAGWPARVFESLVGH